MSTEERVHGISLDLSKARTGIVKWVDREPVKSLSVEFSGDTGEMLASFRHKVIPLITDGVDWVAFEDVRPVNKHHSEIHFGMVGALAEVAYRRGIPFLRVTSSAAKRALTTNGRADKKMMLDEARRKYPGAGVTNHDEADALGVGIAATRMIEFDEDTSGVREVLSPF